MSAKDDTISRAAAIDLIEHIETERLKGNIELSYAPAIKGLRALPPAEPEYKPATLDDFPKTMSASDIYNFWERNRGALKQMQKMGFVVCKKTTPEIESKEDE